MMYALIVSSDGQDDVYVGSLSKMEKKAIEVIRGEIDLDSPEWESFGKLDIEKLLMESMEHSEPDSAMDLFSEISEARGEMIFMRIVRADMEFDA